MEKKDIKQICRDFKRDFGLTLADLALIIKPEEASREGVAEKEILRLEKIAKRMNIIRRELKEITDDKSELNDLLFAYNKNLKMSYFDAMVEEHFDTVIEDIAEFKQDNFRRE